MSTKTLVIAACWGVATGIFFGVGADVINGTKYDWQSVGLGLLTLGFVINLLWQPSAPSV